MLHMYLQAKAIKVQARAERKAGKVETTKAAAKDFFQKHQMAELSVLLSTHRVAQVVATWSMFVA